jgi:fructoselysine-6-P-deglycase FrlB-like protein
VDEPPEKRTVVFFFNLDDEAEALRLAKEIAQKTGRLIAVKKSDGTDIETVFPTRH